MSNIPEIYSVWPHFCSGTRKPSRKPSSLARKSNMNEYVAPAPHTSTTYSFLDIKNWWAIFRETIITYYGHKDTDRNHFVVHIRRAHTHTHTKCNNKWQFPIQIDCTTGTHYTADTHRMGSAQLIKLLFRFHGTSGEKTRTYAQLHIHTCAAVSVCFFFSLSGVGRK